MDMAVALTHRRRNIITEYRMLAEQAERWETDSAAQTAVEEGILEALGAFHGTITVLLDNGSVAYQLTRD